MNRRRFFKLIGFGLPAAMVSGKILELPNKPRFSQKFIAPPASCAYTPEFLALASVNLPNNCTVTAFEVEWVEV